MGNTGSRRRWKLWIGSAVVLALVLGAIVYAGYFAKRGLPGASAAGLPATGIRQDQLAQEIYDEASEVTIGVKVDGHDRTYTLSDLGISVDAEATAQEVFAKNKSIFARFSAMFSKSDTPLVFTEDKDKAAEVISELVSEYGRAAKDAVVQLNEKGSSFVVDPSESGLRVNVNELNDTAQNAAQTLSSQQIELNTEETDPSMTTEKAQAIADKANKLVATEVSVTGPKKSSLQASATEKAGWVTLPADDGSVSEPSVDTEKLKAWVQKTAESTEVAVVNGIRNIDSSGKVVSISQEGKEGLEANNVDQVAAGLAEKFAAGEAYEGAFTYDKVKPTYKEKIIAEGADKLAYAAAPDERWIDVNLTTNAAIAYEGATVARGPMYFVPGMPGMETPTGKFAVYLKYRTQTMRGTNPDGTSYVAPGIPWVTYFTGSIAFHGAPWRDSFGWNGPGGSHGCLNMPVEDAAFIHGWAPMGAVVVSHY